jgi:hypothetical protein
VTEARDRFEAAVGAFARDGRLRDAARVETRLSSIA